MVLSRCAHIVSAVRVRAWAPEAWYGRALHLKIRLPVCSIATTEDVDLGTAVSWCGPFVVVVGSHLFDVHNLMGAWSDRQQLIRRFR